MKNTPKAAHAGLVGGGFRSGAVLALLLSAAGFAGQAGASVDVPLQFVPDNTIYNFCSLRGVPVATNLPGSDGRLPDTNESGTGNPVTPRQFSSLLSLGGGLGLKNADWLAVSNNASINGSTPFSLSIAQAMKLPMAQGSSEVIIQRRVLIGAPYVSRVSSCLFGSVMPAPPTDESDGPLPEGVAPDAYWAAEPHTTNLHANAEYYWSPNARQVYATQPGPLTVTWKKATPYAPGAALPAYTNRYGTESFSVDGGNRYLLYTVRYNVSSTAVKPPRTIYWTEGVFQNTGRPVEVNKSRVRGGVRIVYNSFFPETVADNYAAAGQSTNSLNPLSDRKTLFYNEQDNHLHVWNAEGRAFVELLGDPRGDGSHESLGFEIVDVVQQPLPVDVVTELGEQLLPPPGTPDVVTPELVSYGIGLPFAYEHNIAGSDQVELFAVQATRNLNDCLVLWMEYGLQGLKWPTLLGRYSMVWPNDAGRYSHYIRPSATTDAQAMLTAVALKPETIPTIDYQDPFDRPRAKLTTDFKFYTVLDATVPAHRTLLRFTSGDNIAFERVFSWLDTCLKTTNFAGTVAENLTQVIDARNYWVARPAYESAYADYQVAYAAYTNQLAQHTAYTNYQAQYTAYTNYQARYAAYTNYQARYADYASCTSYADYVAAYSSYATNRARGVNGTWRLFARDDEAVDYGTISIWSVIVQQRDSLGNPAESWINNTTSIAVPDLSNANHYPSILSVDGITNFVESIKARITLSHWKPRDFDILLSGPRTNITYLMSDVGSTNHLSHQLYFADQGTSGTVPDTGSLPNAATWLPSNIDNTETPPTGYGFTGPILTNLNALIKAPVTFMPLPSVFAVDPGAAPFNPGDVSPPAAEDPGSAPVPPAELALNDEGLPRVVSEVVSVGERLVAPDGELGQNGYWAGHVNTNIGTSYNPGAYVDPMVGGFVAANLGAIIPINAIPGSNLLDVWWFRANSSGTAGHNAGNVQLGFATAYWPSVLGRYTIVWPADAREIVLASSQGSGTLDTFESSGSIYYQNAADQAGYNPNEEHAIMYGGSAYATRDDLNITTPGSTYSSDPFVLVDYLAQDGRPAMSVFHVRREAPERGYVFDYPVVAGQLLQAPMPLPLLAKPVEGSGDQARSLNAEPPRSGGDVPGNWSDELDLAGTYSNYARFTWQDRHQDTWVYRGPHAGQPALQAGTYRADGDLFVPLSNATAVVAQSFRFAVHASRTADRLALALTNAPGYVTPLWLQVDGLAIVGTPPAWSVGDIVIRVIVSDREDGTATTNDLAVTVAAAGDVRTQGGAAIVCSNSYTHTTVTFSNRPPFLARSPTPTNSFTMRYYYKTESSFAWPGLERPPSVGSIVPYLLPRDANGLPVGDATNKATAALDIVYRPYWPASAPELPYAYTLAQAGRGLPGVADWKSAEILYQQSIAADVRSASASAVLFDPTREKVADLQAHGLSSLPAGVVATYYQGKYYFPNLPPHLSARLFLDPNRSASGSLVLRGVFQQEVLGESYFHLNILRGSDLSAALALCPSNDTDYAAWTTVVESLAAAVETFHENAAAPGTYIADSSKTVSAGVGDVVVVSNANTMADSYALSATGPGSGYIALVENSGTARTETGDPVKIHIVRTVNTLHRGELKVLPSANPLSELVTFQHTADLAGDYADYEYEWKIAAPIDGMPPARDDTMSAYLSLVSGTDVPRYVLGGVGIRALCDNYVTLRFRSANPAHPLYGQWSAWTEPALCEGWIKRVLAGINPFLQRTADLFNNQVNTDVSMLTQAGHRWEGDVALNADTLNDHGLVEIYETVLRRGRMLSIDAGYNYGPANDALLLVSGYLNDLYMMIGNEAWADAANPTIGIGTSDATYGDIATALFAFKGQEASLIEEELALLRGRDDFLQPGVGVSPVYNRLVWNYTRGIDAGEVIYALNYNIQENPDAPTDGIVNASDAARMFPQGHGDAYGHYLTALGGYYSLLVNSYFDWVPRIEAVNILGTPVSVDYQDERKFAAAAVAFARAGQQAMGLTWRKDFASVGQSGWAHLSVTRSSATRTRYWGVDHWSSRVGQGAFVNWVVGNAMLPDEDPNPSHEGIQKVDRTTVPELTELAELARAVQTDLDNAEAGLTPLGLPEGAVAFDIDPTVVVGTDNGTHFEQIYGRAKAALGNAMAAFDDAKDVTRMMRAEQDSLTDFQAQVTKQEQAYKNALIEIYGTPYPDDMGPGKSFSQDYSGPDLVHYTYVDLPDYSNPNLVFTETEFVVNLSSFPDDWTPGNTDFNYFEETHAVTYNIGPSGYLEKPASWTGLRASPGRVQQSVSDVLAAYRRLQQAGNAAGIALANLQGATAIFQADIATHDEVRSAEYDKLASQQALETAKVACEICSLWVEAAKDDIRAYTGAMENALPDSTVLGLATGGDLTSVAKAALERSGYKVESIVDGWKRFRTISAALLQLATDTEVRWVDFNVIATAQWEQELRHRVDECEGALTDLQNTIPVMARCIRELDDARAKLRATIAAGDRIQAERETFRRRSAVIVQGYRTRDAGFRLFRNEKLERYKTLFDLAARYAYLAANAYDYETGLLNTSAGQTFLNRIVSARALGVVQDGEPQYAGSNTGDPGLSSVLAEMKADWNVLRGRLGFNNPDAYGTTVSLRWEGLRISPLADGDQNWMDLLMSARMDDILEDSDVRKHCMQVDDGSGRAVPGIVLSFRTTIQDGKNLLGQVLGAGDHNFNSSSFATKIFAVGVALEGYRGMDNPSLASAAGGTSPPDPTTWYLDPLALAATPYVYLIPCGLDCMRSPPLGDTRDLRSWAVKDVAIPMPFNIGASDFSTKVLWQSSDSLTEELFAIRKHQAFRPVSTTSVFNPSLYGANGTLQRSQFMNNRLVGRSVWNTEWKLVIPGQTLLNNPKAGLDRFVQTVKDAKLYFVTYSYSGN